jgi:hypothetical protein
MKYFVGLIIFLELLLVLLCWHDNNWSAYWGHWIGLAIGVAMVSLFLWVKSKF